MATLGEIEVKHLHSYGWLVIQGLLQPTLLKQADSEIRNSERFQRQSGKCLQANDPYLRAFDRIMNLWRILPKVHELVFDSGIGQISSLLLQCKAVRLSHDQCLYKPPTGDV